MLKTAIAACVIAAAIPAIAQAKACPVEGARYEMIDAPQTTALFRYDGRGGPSFEIAEAGRPTVITLDTDGGRGPGGGPGGPGRGGGRSEIYMFTAKLQALDSVYRRRDNVAPDYVFVPDFRGGRGRQPNMFRMVSCQR
ncbi:hypothetical protein BH11PSE2_BH11PSE2_00980 [soil metagenome]